MFEPELLTRTNGIMRRDAELFTDEFSEKIGNMSGRCIDIGTGAGDVTVDFILPKLNPKATLLCSDISEDMVNYGRETYGNIDRLSFMKLNIEAPELPKDLVGQFDHLTSLYCLHWCHDTRQALKNMYSLIRPGGTAFLTFVAKFPALGVYAELQEMPKYQDFIKNDHCCIPPFQGVERPREPVMTLLNDIGFQVEICSWRMMNYIWDTMESAEDLFLAGIPFNTDEMPADLKSEYMRDLMRIIMEREIIFNKDRNNKDEFSLLARYDIFIVYAKKPLE